MIKKVQIWNLIINIIYEDYKKQRIIQKFKLKEVVMTLKIQHLTRVGLIVFLTRQFEEADIQGLASAKFCTSRYSSRMWFTTKIRFSAFSSKTWHIKIIHFFRPLSSIGKNLLPASYLRTLELLRHPTG